jgi:uncharacterized membrane protein YdjX (TVP38/TMEM64 family)
MARLRPLIAIGTGVALVAVAWRSGLFDDLSVDGFRAHIESFGALGPLVFMGIVIAGFFLPGPETVLMGLGGAVFGATAGFVYGWMGAVVGTLIPFLLVRLAIRRGERRPDAIRFRRLRAIDERLAERGFATVLVLRLILCLAPPLNWALGAEPRAPARLRARDGDRLGARHRHQRVSGRRRYGGGIWRGLRST